MSECTKKKRAGQQESPHRFLGRDFLFISYVLFGIQIAERHTEEATDCHYV